MKFRYTPDGAPAREWDYDPNRMLNAEAEEVERRTGMDFGAWSNAVTNSNVRAIHGLLYVLLKRDIPTIKWDEVVFTMGEVELVLELADKIRIRDELRERVAAGGISEDDARPVLAELEEEIAAETPVLDSPAEPDPDYAYAGADEGKA